MTSRERRKQILARKLHIAEVEMAINASTIARSTNLGRPLKQGRIEAGIPIRARVEPSTLAQLRTLTGRTPSEIVETGIRLLHACMTNDDVAASRIVDSMARLTKQSPAC